MRRSCNHKREAESKFDTYKGDDVKTEAGSTAMQPQAKEYHGRPATSRSQNKQGTDDPPPPPPSVSGGNMACWHPDLGFLASKTVRKYSSYFF